MYKLLFSNGDFMTRSNEVETAYRRVNPDDWDDDGIANERDLNPLVCDGDFYGVANDLPSNANPNAYYWLDLSVTGLLDCATIRVTCDGPSDLGDHCVIARTNQVCHIPFLVGATYAVESDLPIADSAVSSEHAEIATNSATSLTVFLPLELSFERVQTRGGYDRYIAHTTPIDIGPRILNVAGGCCSCVANEMGFAWNCFPQCACGGSMHSLSCAAEWEGYSHPFYWLGRCHCYYEDLAAIDEIESRGVSLEILDASGNAIEWKYPVLVGESVIVEATVGGSGMTVADFVGLFGGRIRLKACYVDFDGAHDITGAAIPISAATATSQGQYVFRVSVASGWLQSNGIVRNTDDGIVAKTSVDMSLSNREEIATCKLLMAKLRSECADITGDESIYDFHAYHDVTNLCWSVLHDFDADRATWPFYGAALILPLSLSMDKRYDDMFSVATNALFTIDAQDGILVDTNVWSVLFSPELLVPSNMITSFRTIAASSLLLSDSAADVSAYTNGLPSSALSVIKAIRSE